MFSKALLGFGHASLYTRPMRKYLDIPLTAILAITLTVAMLWPLDAPPPAPEGSDKLVHFIAFAALAFPLARTGCFELIPVFVEASAFGGIIELIQPSFGPSTDMQDGIADIAGVALGIVLALDTSAARKRMEDAGQWANNTRTLLLGLYLWNLVDVLVFHPSKTESVGVSIGPERVGVRYSLRF